MGMKRLASCILLALLVLTSAASAQENTPTPEPTYLNYTVVQGDTLGSIAARYGTTTIAILRANSIVNPNLIFAGTVLRIPVNQPSPSVTATETPIVVRPVSTAEVTEAATEPPGQSAIGLEIGGEVFGFDHADVMQSARMTWAKVQVYWVQGDSTDTAKHFIDLAHAAGFKVLLQVSGDPQELAADPQGYESAFADYLGEVAALAPEAIEVWGSMNTPDGWASGMISPVAYEQMLIGVYGAVKRANPQVLVITGALAELVDFNGCTNQGCDDLSYLSGMASAAVGQVADCIGLRYTLGAVPPDDTSGDPRGDQFVYYYPTVISVYAGIFPNKPLCITEIGYLIPAIVPLVSRFQWAENTTPENRAEWLARAAVLAGQSGRIPLFIVYNVDATEGVPQSNYAILSGDGSCLACLTLNTALRGS